MRYDSSNMPIPTKVVDDATGQELHNVMWVDDVTMEYGTFGSGVCVWGEPIEMVTKVSRVQVDWANAVIHVNEAPRVIQGVESRVERACDECCQEGTCRRIRYCAQWRCDFGAVNKP